MFTAFKPPANGLNPFRDKTSVQLLNLRIRVTIDTKNNATELAALFTVKGKLQVESLDDFRYTLT